MENNKKGFKKKKERETIKVNMRERRKEGRKEGLNE